ncbi:aspartate/glutamate racemase family protein [Paraferrimonas sp. SM1919]|uniref:aspartate/glutamate racemase family protein n=1 Tax=Paraferrimonas sp. SM1919 TaxID=2662263 RepID=UPI0013D5776D|nr:aspartate/glutamate racemase family protein [Paraferrimonas sp. SM1919]
MKTIGIIGGMSWESTMSYYQLINKGIKQRLGGLHSAKVIINSVDFAEIEALQAKGEWQQAAVILSKAAVSLQNAGADFLLIATNTMHKVAPEVSQAINIPLLHIAEATARALKQKGITTVALLGTRYTMEQDFYKQVIIDHGIEVVIPSNRQVNEVNRVIYDELCLGQISLKSKQIYLNIINEMQQQGAQGVILGCTEIGLLVQQADTSIPLFDTTEIHAKQAIEFALYESV